MDIDTAMATPLFALSVVGILAGITAWLRYDVAHDVGVAWARYLVRADVALAAERHAAEPAPRHRHNVHCPGCGRFARLSSTSPLGTWTVCAAHGLQLRRAQLIGVERDRILIEIRTHGGPELPAPIGFDLAPPARLSDWLDTGRVPHPLKLALNSTAQLDISPQPLRALTAVA